jgi:hypothetical protein
MAAFRCFVCESNVVIVCRIRLGEIHSVFQIQQGEFESRTFGFLENQNKVFALCNNGLDSSF